MNNLGDTCKQSWSHASLLKGCGFQYAIIWTLLKSKMTNNISATQNKPGQRVVSPIKHRLS